MPFFFCTNCRTVYFPELDENDGGLLSTPTCTNHTCSRYGMACERVPEVK